MNYVMVFILVFLMSSEFFRIVFVVKNGKLIAVRKFSTVPL